MAATPSSKPGAVHFWLIFFVMSTLILLVTTIMFAKNHGEALALTDAAKKAESNANGAVTNLNADIEALKAVVGHNQADVGVGTPAPANTVRAAAANDLTLSA